MLRYKDQHILQGTMDIAGFTLLTFATLLRVPAALTAVVSMVYCSTSHKRRQNIWIFYFSFSFTSKTTMGINPIQMAIRVASAVAQKYITDKLVRSPTFHRFVRGELVNKHTITGN